MQMIGFAVALLCGYVAAEQVPQLYKVGETSNVMSTNEYCNALKIGEVRVYADKTQCLDIHGHDGSGNLQTFQCEGLPDQKLLMCDDGTIRNQASNHCFTTSHSDGTGDVSSGSCNGSEYQKWDFTIVGHFHDAGIYQDVYKITNRASGQCLDIEGNTGSGDADIYTCTGEPDQMFYFRDRGAVVHTGRIYNAADNQCLNYEVEGVTCDSSHVKQFWTMYENGEILNNYYGTCMDVEGYSGAGQVGNFNCEDKLDQMWDAKCQDDYCYYVNRRDPNQCLDARGKGKNVYSQTCNWSATQQFKWIN